MAQIRSEISNHISRYLNCEIALQDFEDWFAPVLWELSDSHDERSRSLAGTISNRIAEYSSGYMSEDVLRKELAAAIHPFDEVVLISSNATDCGSSGTQRITPQKETGSAFRYHQQLTDALQA